VVYQVETVGWTEAIVDDCAVVSDCFVGGLEQLLGYREGIG
jgi:hypothetical protein